MKPKKRRASETERAPGAVYKRVKAGEKKKDEAKSEEAAESGQQQECILSGEVYLRHRLGKARSSKNLPVLLFPTEILYLTNCQRATCGVQACRRAGVQETVPLSDLTFHKRSDTIQ